MSGYKIEAITKGYIGPTELPFGTKFNEVGVLTESFVPGTDLPYRSRELKTPHIFRGYAIDGALLLGPDRIVLTPQGLDPESFQKLLGEFSRKNPGISLPSRDSFANVSIGIRHLRQEKGAKIVLPFGDHEYDCLLVPPPDPNLRKGFF